MGIRTTSSDPVGFIYDSVTGLAIGECWSDEDEMEAFVKWYQSSEDTPIPLQNLPSFELNRQIQMFHVHFWIKSST